MRRFLLGVKRALQTLKVVPPTVSNHRWGSVARTVIVIIPQSLLTYIFVESE